MILFFLFSFLFNQGSSHVDGLVAVVGDRHILKSEVLEQTLLLAQQKNINPQKTPLLLEKLYNKVLNERIDRLVVLFIANQDTSISVEREEINQSLDDRVAVFVDSFGSKKTLEDSLGLSIKELKSQYWNLVRDEILVEKFRFKLFGNVSTNKQEVVSFFKNNLDSFPQPPPLGSYSIIEQPVDISKTTKDSLFSLALALIDSINNNSLSFSNAAKKHSQHKPSAKEGGFLPVFNRGSFSSDFEQRVFSLNVGEISPPFETALGLHVVKLVERVGERVGVQQILLSLQPNDNDLKQVVSLFGSYKEKFLNDPGAFDSLAVVYRQRFRNSSGFFENSKLSSLSLFLQKQFLGLGDFSFSDPFVVGGSVFLFYKYSQNKKVPFSLENNWSEIEAIVLNYKKFKAFTDWLKLQKEKTYIKIFNN